MLGTTKFALFSEKVAFYFKFQLISYCYVPLFPHLVILIGFYRNTPFYNDFFPKKNI